MNVSWNVVTDLRAMWQVPFIRQGLEAGTIAAVMAGVVGYFVILRRSTFASHALGHVGFSGAAGAVLFGINPVYGLLLFTMGGGTGMALLGRRASTRDIEIGTVLAFMLGLGVVFIDLYHGYSGEAYSILFGNIEGVSEAGVVLTLEAAVGVLAAVALLYRPLLFSSLDEDVAEAKGLPLLALNLCFMLLLAVAISFSVQIIGVLLIFALTVTPAATAVLLTKRPLFAVIVAVSIGVFSIWAGMLIAWVEQAYSPSFFIVSVAFVLYVAVRGGAAVSSRFLRKGVATAAVERTPGPESA